MGLALYGNGLNNNNNNIIIIINNININNINNNNNNNNSHKQLFFEIEVKSGRIFTSPLCGSVNILPLFTSISKNNC